MEPQQDKIQLLVSLYSQGKFQRVLDQTKKLQQQFPNSAALYNIRGATYAGLRQFDAAVESYRYAIRLKPNYPDAYNNLGEAQRNTGNLDSAIESYSYAIRLKPDYAEAYNNLGIAQRNTGNLDSAIENHSYATNLRPDYAEAYNNLGCSQQQKGNLGAAMDSYRQAIKLKPDYAEAYNNLGTAWNYNGNLEVALESYRYAIKLKPDYAEAYKNVGVSQQQSGDGVGSQVAYKAALKLNPNDAEVHRLLSGVKKYNRSDVQIVQMEELYEYGGINNEQRCQLCFALHKVYEDLKDLSRSFKYLMEGNALRKEILGYDIQKDKKLFTTLKIGNEKFCAKSLKYDLKPNMPIPIFILGMPRSGTTLVEQIVSSHSKVYGAGELGHVGGFGSSMALGEPKPTKRSLINFRDLYLGELKRLSNESFFVTDKMPLNFRYIGLIRAALPEAKIIHVERNAAATCFSNFKIYFSQNGLGYSNNLDDLVKYYQMYKDLMQFWRDQFPGLIYDLNYDTLVSDQEKEIRGLIQHIGIAWEDVCLSPQKNKRSVRTASQDQIRKKIYKGSSHEWQKFKQFTGGALDVLKH